MYLPLEVVVLFSILSVLGIFLTSKIMWDRFENKKSLIVERIYVSTSESEGLINFIIAYSEGKDEATLAIRGTNEANGLWNLGVVRQNEGRTEFKTAKTILNERDLMISRVLKAANLSFSPDDPYPESPDLSW